MLLELNPIAFELGPFAVRWYGLFLALAFLIGGLYVFKKAREYKISDDFILNLAFLVIIFGIIGARLIYVLANAPDWFVNEPLQVLMVHKGGLAWHGGLLGGVIAGWLYSRREGVNFNLIADFTVPAAAIGYSLIRIGNIFNQEVLGRMTDFWFELWPAQPIAILIMIVLLIRYFWLENKGLPPGYQFWSFIFYHQFLRFLIEEPIRDNPLVLIEYIVPQWGLGFLTPTQIATPFIMAFTFIMMRRTMNKRY